MIDQHAAVYKEEAGELLAELEGSLLELEKSPDDKELIAKIFRAMHTIKGSGAMFGFNDVATFTHNVETVYDQVRNDKFDASKKLIDLTLAACDQIRRMVDGDDDIDQAKTEELTAAFKNFIPDDVEVKNFQPLIQSNQTETVIEDMGKSVTYRITFKPHADIFANGTNPTLLLNELRTLGVGEFIAQMDAIPHLDKVEAERCYTYWDIVLTTNKGINAIKDVFIFVEDKCELKIVVIDEPGLDDGSKEYKKIGEILIEKGELNKEALENALGTHKKIGELLVESGLVTPDKVEAALAEQQHVREIREKRQATDTAASIRVPAERLDRLVDMVGELVTIQSRLSQMATKINDADLVLVAEEVERLTAELRDNTMSIRMMPIGNTFSKFKRLVRDLSSELGKQINLITEGAETELDKTVIEKLNDPLIHIIRNSIDHGIESPAAREKKGKSQQGTICLSAEHSGANVLIRINDDGAGIDPEAIRMKAIERGIPSDGEMTEKELFALLFAPGFSMAKKVTSVSGRGVGMDVVKRGIDSLGGTISIESKLGSGTTITLKLPLTLAIIDGLLVQVAESFFVLPLSAIEECVELTREDVAQAHGQQIIHIRGEVVPYIPLRERFGITGDPPSIEQVIINRVGDERIGLVVDQVIGQHQTVIKNMGKLYRHIHEVSGATILGDGTVALIVDLNHLSRVS